MEVEDILNLEPLRCQFNQWNVLICPVCLKQFEIEARIATLILCRGQIFWCSHRCKLIFNISVSPQNDQYADLLIAWIADNQIYQVITRHPKETDRSDVITTISENMLDFDLEKTIERPVLHQSVKIIDDVAREIQIKNLVREGKNNLDIHILTGYDPQEIIAVMNDAST